MPTKIEWCDETWNPIKMRCTPVSEGCQNCYVGPLLNRNLPGLRDYPKPGEPPRLDERVLLEMYRWRKPRKIFVESMGDLFHEDIRDDLIDNIFTEMLDLSVARHTFMLLTKRPNRMRRYITGYISRMELFPNVWLGVTAENQRTADERIPVLLQIPAAVHFVSVEPMLGPVDLSLNRSIASDRVWVDPYIKGLDWVICGAETGPGARPMDIDWALDLRKQCGDAGVPFFFKKWGKDAESRLMQGALQMPRQFPLGE